MVSEQSGRGAVLLLFPAGACTFICSSEGTFFYFKLCNLKCIFSRKSWILAVQSTLLMKPELCLIHFDSTLLLPVIFVTAGIPRAGYSSTETCNYRNCPSVLLFLAVAKIVKAPKLI